MSDTVLLAIAALLLGFLLGVYAENWATNKNEQAIRERRLRRLLADLRNEPPEWGELHFHDGPIRPIYADSVSDALDKLQRNA